MLKFRLFLIIIFLVVCSILPVFSQTAKKFFSSAEKFQEALNYKDALDNYSKAIELDPNYSKAYSARAFCYEKLGKNAEAATDYKRAAVFSPKDKELYYNAGRLFFEIADYTESQNMLKLALDRDKDYEEAIEVQLKVLLKLKNYNEGLKLADESIKNKKTAPAYYYHAIMFDSLKNYVDAEKEYKNSKYFDSKFIPAYVGVMLVQIKLLKFDEALTIADVALIKSPNNFDVYVARAQVYAAKGDYQNAVSDMSRVISTNQTNPIFFFMRGEYYQKMAQYQSAISDFTKIIGLDPQNGSAYYNRAFNYEQLGNFKSAAADYEKMITLAPNDYKAKEMMKNAIDKLFELNRESFKPEIVLSDPKPNDRNVIKIAGNKTEFVLNGEVRDASKIASIVVNDIKVDYNKDSLNPTFSQKVLLVNVNEVTIMATDVYNNTQKIIYSIERTETDKPIIELVAPFASSNNEIYLDKDAPELYIEGKIKDESLIESIMIEGAQASFQLSDINPTFSTKLNIANKTKMNIHVKDVYGNETDVTYAFNREGISLAKDNPMGNTWVVFVENSTYKNFASLSGPAKDVTNIKAALANYKVNNIIHKKNMSKVEMEKFFKIDLRDQIKSNHVKSLLVWYTGHGKFVNKTGYWIPVDAARDDEFSYFDIGTLKDALKVYSEFALEHQLVVTDACESGPSFMTELKGDENKTCGNPEFFEMPTAQVVSAAGLELAAGDSKFSEEFAKALINAKDGCISIDKVYLNLKEPVKKASGQEPKFGELNNGKHIRPSTFFFIKK